MSKLGKWNRVLIAAAAAAIVPAAVAWSTPGTGTSSVLVGRATFGEGFKVTREAPALGWEAEVEVKPDLDIAVQTITFQPGSQSGWHSHPGPVFIMVVEGSMTFYESHDCTPIVRYAGEGYLDTGEHAHIARNETLLPAKNVVTYFAPPGAALRIDQPQPTNCPF